MNDSPAVDAGTEARSASPGAVAAQASAWPDPLRAWWHVIVLTVAYIVSFADRTIISLLVEPIKADLGIGDTEIALLQGVAFALCFAVMGFPLGWIADRWSRRGLIAAGAAFWGVATACCGVAGNFGQLFVARVGVGVGEASLSPAAVSTIGDLFPREKRGLPIGLYTMAVSLGAGLALILGGAMIAWIGSLPPVELPLAGRLAPWQVAFVTIGLGGTALLLLLLATVREPRRQQPPAAPGQPKAGIWRHMAAHWRFFSRHYAGVALYSILAGSVLSWGPTLFIRRFGWDAAEVGLRYGLVFLIFGAMGTLLSGALSGHLLRRGVKAAPVWVAGSGIALVAPFMTIVGFVDDEWLALAFLGPALAFFTSPGATALQAIQDAAPGNLRGRSAAVYSFAVTMVGMSVGPLVVALFTEFVFADPMSIGPALAMTTLLCAPLSGLLILWGRKPFEAACEGH